VRTALVPIDTGRSKPYLLEVTTQDLPIRGLPESLHGATFVHLTDLHGGFGSLEPVYEEILSRTDALQPDLILLTGDYVDDDAKPIDYPMQDVLCRLHARLGVYGTLGNHEHRRGPVQARRMLEKGGVRLLNNASVCLESGLWAVGIDDIDEGKPDIPRAFAGVPGDVTPIVLSHHPHGALRIGEREALVLSGHTHGGQIVLPLLPSKLVCWLHLRCWQVAGWYRYGRVRQYVNRGVGVTGQPFRYNCPAEMAIFRLQPASEASRPEPREREAVGVK
jgi:hypothetical protein